MARWSKSRATFEVSLKSSSLDDDDDGDDHVPHTFHVSVDQVITVDDWDVFLHSLRGAKELNGRLGIVTASL